MYARLLSFLAFACFVLAHAQQERQACQAQDTVQDARKHDTVLFKLSSRLALQEEAPSPLHGILEKDGPAAEWSRNNDAAPTPSAPFLVPHVELLRRQAESDTSGLLDRDSITSTTGTTSKSSASSASSSTRSSSTLVSHVSGTFLQDFACSPHPMRCLVLFVPAIVIEVTSSWSSLVDWPSVTVKSAVAGSFLMVRRAAVAPNNSNKRTRRDYRLNQSRRLDSINDGTVTRYGTQCLFSNVP